MGDCSLPTTTLQGPPTCLVVVAYNTALLLHVQEAHQDAHGHHFPSPDSADVYVYGARLVCRPGVRVLVGPVIGEVTANSAVGVVRCEAL